MDASTVFEVFGRQKSDRFLRYFRKGFEGVPERPFSHTFNDFGWPTGCKKETILELASAFFEVREFDDFRALRPEGPAAEGEPT